jgi:hypothetical protein
MAEPSFVLVSGSRGAAQRRLPFSQHVSRHLQRRRACVRAARFVPLQGELSAD